MASVIDLTDDLRAELAMAQNLGAGFGSAAGYIVADHRRRRTERMIVSTLQEAATQGLSVEDTRKKILGIPNIVRTQIGQELMEAQTGTGKYYRNPLETEYLQSRIDATKALTNSRTGAGGASSIEVKRWNDIYKTALEAYGSAQSMNDADAMKIAEQQMRMAQEKLNQFSNAGQSPERAPLGTANRVGLQVGDFMEEAPVRNIPAAQNETPQITQSPKPDIAAQAMEGQAFTGEPPAGQMAKWQSMTPEQRVAYFTGKETKADTELAAELNKQNFAPYMDKLDGESRQQLQAIIAEGNPKKIQIALQRLRQTYGTL